VPGVGFPYPVLPARRALSQRKQVSLADKREKRKEGLHLSAGSPAPNFRWGAGLGNAQGAMKIRFLSSLLILLYFRPYLSFFIFSFFPFS
jgi:hypothetical protein